MAQGTRLLFLTISRFTGINATGQKFTIDDTQATDILNWVLDERGSLRKIPGYVRWNETPVGTGAFQGGERFYRLGANPEFIEVHNGTIYKGDDATKTFTSVYTGLNATASVRMKAYRDLLFIVNGVDAPVKWNGTTVTKMGLVAPSTAPTASDSGIAGNLNGTYSWKVTFVSATHESNPSPASNTLTVTNKQVNLSGIPTSSDPQVTKRRIYRTLAGGSIFKFVGEINDNTTTTFTDNVADSALGRDAPEGKDAPPIARYIELFKNRLWLAGDPNNPRRLYFSELFEPESWPPTYYVDVPMSPGDEITGLRLLGDVLVVFGHNTPYLMIGETPFDFTLKRSFAQQGTESDRSVALVENALIYLSRSGVWAFDGAVARLLSDEIDPILQRASISQFSKAAAVYHSRTKLYHLAIPYTPGATNNTHELIYDLRYNAWVMSDRAIAYYHLLDGPGDFGDIYSASTSEGRLYHQWSGETADGSAITSIWRSKAYTLGLVDMTKRIRLVHIWRDPTTNSQTIDVTCNDDNKRTFSFSAPASTIVSRYGTAKYGTAQYAGQAIEQVSKSVPDHMLGNYVQVTVTDSGLARSRIYSIELGYLPISFRLP